jgi:hypothetical protein
MRHCILFFYLTFLTSAFAQWTPSVLTVDTVSISNRLGGRLDSLDVFFPSLTTYPNAWNGMSIYDPIVLLNQPGGLRILSPNFKTTYKYSGLPHIGFGYSFGTKGLQSSKMEYQQVFAKKLLVNLSYSNNRANGFLRNQDLKFNDIELGLLKKGRFYSFELNAFERNLDNALNGGIGTNADLGTFPLIFQPVRKSNTREFLRNSGLQMNNFFDFQKDSIKSFGVMTKSELMVRSRRYEEFDTLWGLYPTINLDSLQSSDRYQWSTVTQGAGVFYKDKGFYANVRIDGKYWKYYNLGVNHDTLELSLASDFEYSKDRLKIGQIGFFNFSGAGNEWSSEQYIKYRLKFFRLSSNFSVEQRWPDIFQRHYFANNFSINAASDYQLQLRLGIVNEMVFDKFRLPLFVTHRSVYLKNNYFWNGQQWSHSLFSSISAHQIAFSTRYEVGVLSLTPRYTTSLVNGLIRFMPKHQFDLRLSVSGGLFKAKKPKAYAGVDLKWQSSIELIDFLPVLGVYQFASGIENAPSLFNLHAFAGFQIDEFRFFVRYENIGYFWNEPTLELMKGYPIPSGHLRFGLTWDFFN